MGFTTDASAPTAEWVFEQSRLRWSKLGVSSASALSEVLEDAIGYFTWITGRYFTDYVPAAIPDGDSGAVTYAYTPASLADAPELIRQARRAIRMVVEQQTMQDQPGYIDTATDDIVQSFSAGSYSETRFDRATLRGGRSAQKALLNSWPGLNDILTQLMTDERRDYWNMVMGGVVPPAFSVEEVDWSLVGSQAFPSLFGDAMAPTPPAFPVFE